MSIEALFNLYSGTPRQGPGSESSTLQALKRLAPLPAGARVLDVGCGTGTQTLVLARSARVPIIALDIHAPFLARLAWDVCRSGVTSPVFPVQASMESMPFPPSSFDLVWSEGAAYIAGIAASLRTWHELLRPGGQAAFTELCWISPERPPEAVRYFEAAYPAMLDIAGNRRLIEDAGFELLTDFVLPRSDWWVEYYQPLLARVEHLRGDAAHDPELDAVIAETEAEIDIFSRFGESYGYVFYLTCVSPPARCGCASGCR